jgi:precorrin-2 C20-methyltransferase/precorrin-3B C17-methyltransferase
VGGAGERVGIVALAELDPAAVDMRTLLLVGSSQTRLAERANGERVVYTPRHYPG